MFTFRDRPFVEARRAYRNLCKAHRDEIEDELDFRDSEYLIDHGEFAPDPEPNYNAANGEVQERLFVAVADAFGIDPHRLDDCLFELDQQQQRIDQPDCPYHERGLDCRNSEPRYRDADGEPSGDRGCGCDPTRLRLAVLDRLYLTRYKEVFHAHHHA